MEKIRKLIRPFSIIQFVLVNFGMGVLIVLLFIPGSLHNFQNFLIGSIWGFAICITQWFGAIAMNHIIDRKIKWIDQPILRSVVGFTALIVNSVIAFTAVQFIMLFILYHSTPAEAWPMVSKSIIYTMLISFFMSLIFTAVGFFKSWRRELVNAERLKAEMMTYRYEALRNQINPHFLFNSFNVLSDLVYADQAMAVKFINQLSDLFRYVLDCRDKELVHLKDELGFMNSYIYLLKTRFEDKLQLDIDLEAGDDEFIVPMTLQLLVENAVKHNEVSEAFPLHIHIRHKETYLEVENTLRIKKVGEDSKNTGLKNIIQQFSYFTESPIEVIDADGKFLVRIPLLNISGQ